MCFASIKWISSSFIKQWKDYASLKCYVVLRGVNYSRVPDYRNNDLILLLHANDRLSIMKEASKWLLDMMLDWVVYWQADHDCREWCMHLVQSWLIQSICCWVEKKWNKRDTCTCKQSSTICRVNTVSTKTIKTYSTHAIKCNSGIVANPNCFYAKTEF